MGVILEKVICVKFLEVSISFRVGNYLFLWKLFLRYFWGEKENEGFKKSYEVIWIKVVYVGGEIGVLDFMYVVEGIGIWF